MKRMVVMLSIVGALLTCGAVSQVWLKNYTEQMSDQLELLSDAVGSGEEIRYEIGAILNEWEQYQKRLGFGRRKIISIRWSRTLKMLNCFPGTQRTTPTVTSCAWS
jgi:hypothetical protein